MTEAWEVFVCLFILFFFFYLIKEEIPQTSLIVVTSFT